MKSARGVEMCQKVGTSLTLIVGHARKVDEVVAEIAVASQEQNQGLKQLNEALTRIDQVTQSNAADAEQSAASAAEMQQQAERQLAAVGELRGVVDGGLQPVKGEGNGISKHEGEPRRSTGMALRS